MLAYSEGRWTNIRDSKTGGLRRQHFKYNMVIQILMKYSKQ
jgi:hypothetical protein